MESQWKRHPALASDADSSLCTTRAAEMSLTAIVPVLTAEMLGNAEISVTNEDFKESVTLAFWSVVATLAAVTARSRRRHCGLNFHRPRRQPDGYV